ncbi:winged helix-turn-helix transcriptional regulator [Labedaea rhizosphaerae]|uniref:HxlR family transcriptional regulator n=1 Tax=Labedaea rhizosphaerae TaxID=598644 RepID=A0A4R6SF63_LABRH|nr:helix-turn-helix domain-containing protein [Labedaea rhizosphaerae]TDP97726.1 HxlR family transcriptional regulator [Labedaea rhizosphaerae]
MSDGNTGVPSVLAIPLPAVMPVVDYDLCPVARVFRRLGERWTLGVLVLLGQGKHRFNELNRRIDGISQRMLTRTLRTLESDGLVTRTVLATTPPSVEYALSEAGRSLLGPISAIADWATEGVVRESLTS